MNIEEYIKNVKNRIFENKDIMEDKTADGSYIVPFDNRYVILHILDDEYKKLRRVL